MLSEITGSSSVIQYRRQTYVDEQTDALRTPDGGQTGRGGPFGPSVTSTEAGM